MKTTALLAMLMLAGCAVAPSGQIPARTNSTFTTSQAESYTCRTPEVLVCQEVLGSRVSNQVKDCVCQP